MIVRGKFRGTKGIGEGKKEKRKKGKKGKRDKNENQGLLFMNTIFPKYKRLGNKTETLLEHHIYAQKLFKI